MIEKISESNNYFRSHKIARGKVIELRVAAVQMESVDGAVGRNLEHAAVFVRNAAKMGASLVLFPACMPGGFFLNASLWDTAETFGGPTVGWLIKQSKQHGVWIGTSFLEADGDDFYHTFVLTDPQGEVCGSVRCQKAVFHEVQYFRGEPGPHVINTELGRIGVGIGYENLLSYMPWLMYQQSVDLYLMPHYANEMLPGFITKEKGGVRFCLNEISAYYSQLLGVPVVTANHSGIFSADQFVSETRGNEKLYLGHTLILDSDNTIKGFMESGEGVIVGNVVLDPSRKKEEKPDCYGRWSIRQPWSVNFHLASESIRNFCYMHSFVRRKKAREIFLHR